MILCGDFGFSKFVDGKMVKSWNLGSFSGLVFDI